MPASSTSSPIQAVVRRAYAPVLSMLPAIDEAPLVGGRQPRIPQGARVYAIGDVHGRIDLLRALEPALRRAVQGALAGAAGGSGDRVRASIELLEVFALTGNLPWSVSPTRAGNWGRASPSTCTC